MADESTGSLKVIGLDYLVAAVVGMRPRIDQPHIIVGAAINSALGPCVCLGAGATLDPGSGGLALVGHVSPEVAIQIADRLKEAAAEVGQFLAQGESKQ